MLKIRSLLIVLALVVVPTVTLAVNWHPLPDQAPSPNNNPTTTAKVKLGQMLFHDTRLSSTGTISCASCHNVMLGGEDNRTVAMGVNGQTGGRSAPTVWNAAFNVQQFWDGRAANLEEQAAGPVTNPIEMGMKKWKYVINRLQKIEGYKTAFAAVFGEDSISKVNVTKAIAAYERTLITPNSAYDKYVKGDKNALSAEQIRGMNSFASIGCVSCHVSPVFAGGESLRKFPVYKNGYFEAQYHFKKDKGRAEVTGDKSDKHLWKVPTLRNIALTAPYFHNGAVKTLDKAVKVMAKLQLNKDLSTQEVEDIVAFLKALSGEFPQQQMPMIPGTPGTTFN